MNKKLLVVLISVFLIVMLLTMTSCIGSTLVEKNVKSRLKDEGYTVKNITNCAITDGWNEPDENGNQVAHIGTMLYGTLNPTTDDEGNVTYEHEIWIIYAQDKDSAAWVEKNGKAKAKETGKTLYRHEKIIIYGDLESVRIARGY